MEATPRSREDVPEPSTPRLVVFVVLLAATMMSMALTARKAEAVISTPTPHLRVLNTPPKHTPAGPEDGDEDGQDDGRVRVTLPAHLLAALLQARATNDLELFEDAAHELALTLVT